MAEAGTETVMVKVPSSPGCRVPMLHSAGSPGVAGALQVPPPKLGLLMLTNVVVSGSLVCGIAASTMTLVIGSLPLFS